MESYLADRTILCVENFTRSNISKTAKIESTNLSLTVNIQDDGIAVKADYPLKFSVGKEQFFQLSTFDFFYPSQFRKLLDSAVTRALEQDYRFLEFNYTPDFLESSAYGPYDIYNSLGVKTIRSELSNGDDVFTFTPDIYTVLNTPYPYYFRLARQNRPPALDYVQRYGCPNAEPGYDYLAIRNDNSSLAEINLTLYARDPDEDEFTYSFENVPITLKFLALLLPPEQFYISKEKVNSVAPGFYTLTAKAQDEHGLDDRQEVRVLIDKPISTNLSLTLPYSDINNYFYGAYIVSTEDPVFVNITYPGESLAGISEAKVNLKYTNKEETEQFSFEYQSPSGLQEQSCFSLPWNGKHDCKFEDYKNFNILENWKSIFSSENSNYNHFMTKTSTGKLNLSFSITYCGGELNKSTSAAAQIIVKECLPHQNPQRPFAYPYHTFEFSNYDFENKVGTFVQNNTAPFNPLEATHSCCVGSPDTPLSGWTHKKNTEVCFVDPVPGCYGKNEYGKKILEVPVRYCDGNRGNICGGEIEYILSNSTSSSPSVKQRLICGYNGKPAGDDAKCKGIPPACEGKPAFSIIKYNGKWGWCSGTDGCSEFVTVTDGKPLVYTGSTAVPYYLPSEGGEDALLYSIGKEFLKSNKKPVSNNPPFKYAAGCSGHQGNLCDSDYNGIFRGTCDSGTCKEDK